MILTNEILEAGKSSRGGWSKEQFKCLGLKWRVKRGWKRKVIGRDYSQHTIERFLGLRDVHLIVKKIFE